MMTKTLDLKCQISPGFHINTTGTKQPSGEALRSNLFLAEEAC